MCWLKKFKIRRLQKQLRNMQLSRVQNQASQEQLNKELLTYTRLAKFYAKLHGHKKFPFAKEQELACYRAAAILNDMQAQFTLGYKLLE